MTDQPKKTVNVRVEMTQGPPRNWTNARGWNCGDRYVQIRTEDGKHIYIPTERVLTVIIDEDPAG